MLSTAAFGARRRVAGVMSGTSVDGIDVAIATIDGSGATLRFRKLFHFAEPYTPELRDLILRNSTAETSSVVELSQLNVRLAHAYAGAVRRALGESGDKTLDLVGLHGQTVQHVPDPTDCAGVATRSTLQIGDGSTVANVLGVPTVGDFRMADMALGGQGAPLVPYFDAVVLGDDKEDRIALNLGGIANITVLPAGAGTELSRVRAFDTGPANMVTDALASRLLGKPFDADGRVAAAGRVNEAVVEELLEHAWFRRPPPKSTGREMFGAVFVDELLAALRRSDTMEPADALATSVEFAVRTIKLGYDRFAAGGPGKQLAARRLIASGGGTKNGHLMRRLATAFAPVRVEKIEAHGIPSAAKEALCFAVLAHEFVNGVPTGIPSVTGSSAATLLGKLSPVLTKK